jgi:UDP-N-acetylglucosamine 2-epimerase
VGSSGERLEDAVSRLLTDDAAYVEMLTDESPYGDGQASERIVDWMLEAFIPVAEAATDAVADRLEEPVGVGGQV